MEVLKIDNILHLVHPVRPTLTGMDVYRMIKNKGIEYDPEKGLDLDQTIELLRCSFK